MNESRLTRNESDRMIAGICGGIAAYMELDSVLVRALFVLLLFASGIGFPIYMILWLIMPTDATVSESGNSVIQKNIDDLSQTISKSVNNTGNPGTIGGLLILFGVFFLLRQFGIVSWLHGGVFWPLVIIGFGAYLLLRRSQES